MLRRILFWTHLCLGVATGIMIFAMCVTGVLLAYERQIVAWADHRSATVSSSPTPLPLDDLFARTAQSQPTPPSMITVRNASDHAIEMSFGRDRTLLVDPSTGRVLAIASPGWRAFFHRVEDIHRALGATTRRDFGRFFTGAANMAFLFIVCSGFYLWFPRRWSWAKLRGIVWFRRGLSGRARDFNWHNTVGVWSCIPLFVIVLTAVVMSYPWANNLLFRMTGNQPPTFGPPPDRAAPQREPNQRQHRSHRGDDHGPHAEIAGLSAAFDKAKQLSPGWQSITLRVPSKAEQPIATTVDFGNGGHPDKRVSLTISPTGEVLKTEAFADFNSGRRLRAWFRFLHTGEALGWIGQTIAMLASAGGAFLVLTGVMLAIRRLFAWRARTRSVREDKLEVATAQD